MTGSEESADAAAFEGATGMGGLSGFTFNDNIKSKIIAINNGFICQEK